MSRHKHATRRHLPLHTPARWLATTRRVLGAWLRMPLRQSGMHLATLVLAVLTLSLLLNFVNQVIQSANLEARRAALAEEVALLQTENDELRGAVEFAESDAYVERIAREQLGYARAGETVILPQLAAPTPAPPLVVQAASPATPPVARPNWQRWWHAFQPAAEAVAGSNATATE